jgi:hypothetical protein
MVLSEQSRAFNPQIQSVSKLRSQNVTVPFESPFGHVSTTDGNRLVKTRFPALGFL